MAGRQQDPHQPVAEEEQRDRRSDTTPSHATGGRNEESLGGRGGGGDAHLLVSTPNRIFQFFSLPWWYGFLNTCARTAVYSVVQYERVSGGGARWLRPLCRYLALLPQPLGLLAVDVALHAGLSPGDEHGVPQGESSQSHRHRAARQEEGHHLNLGSQPGPGSTFEGGVGAALTWSEPRGR